MKEIPGWIWPLWLTALLMAWPLAAIAQVPDECVYATSPPASATIIVPDSVGVAYLNAGDVVSVHDAEGTCFGASVYEASGSIGIGARRNDGFSDVQPNGFEVGDQMYMQVNSTPATATLQTEGTLRAPDFSFDDQLLYEIASITTSDAAFEVQLPSEISTRTTTVDVPVTLYSASPNPSYVLDLVLTGATLLDVSAMGTVSYTGTDTLTVAVTPPTLPANSTGTLTLALSLTADTGSVEALSVEAAVSTDDGAQFVQAVIAEDAAVASLSRFLAGDLTGTGVITPEDRLALTQYIIGASALTTQQLQAADVNPYPAGNGNVDLRDLHTLAEALRTGAWPNGSPIEAITP